MKQFNILTNRQKLILQVIDQLEKASNHEILEKIINQLDQTSRITIIRDLNTLLTKGFIKKSGKGRGVIYESKASPLTKSFNVNSYFNEAPDSRTIQETKLDLSKDLKLDEIVSTLQLSSIQDLTREFQMRFNAHSANQIKRELERITIEFSWKSSQIEGNTYTLLDTERLIKQHIEAKGKTHSEAVMILNHKTALDYIWEKPEYFKKISISKIEEIHSLISKDLGIEKGLRKRAVGIIGTAYKPIDNIFQIKQAMGDLCNQINNLENPFIKALIAVALIAYIQPFEDGNKRTSRLVGNAILMAHNYCPLSYRSVDEVDYKKAIIIFYEQHSINYFKELFIKQYEFAVNNYFL